jgi:hypothetical protein
LTLVSIKIAGMFCCLIKSTKLARSPNPASVVVDTP